MFRSCRTLFKYVSRSRISALIFCCLASCKEIQDSLHSLPVELGFFMQNVIGIPDSLSCMLDSRAWGLRIPVAKFSRIPYSTSKNLLWEVSAHVFCLLIIYPVNSVCQCYLTVEIFVTFLCISLEWKALNAIGGMSCIYEGVRNKFWNLHLLGNVTSHYSTQSK